MVRCEGLEAVRVAVAQRADDAGTREVLAAGQVERLQLALGQTAAQEPREEAVCHHRSCERDLGCREAFIDDGTEVGARAAQ